MIVDVSKFLQLNEFFLWTNQKKQFQDSPVFQKYVDSIRIDFGLPDTVDDHVIFQMLAELETWTKKGSAVKQSRWFSWHDSAHDHLKEWWASRMIYEWYFSGEVDIDSIDNTVFKSFKQARESTGGLKLALKCMSLHCFEMTWLVYLCSQPCWTWYTNQVQQVKTSDDNLAQVIEMVDQWHTDDHLCQMASLLSPGDTFCQLMARCRNEDKFSAKTVSYLLELLSLRCGSLSKFGSPPECYARMLSGDDGQVQATSEAMVQDLKWLLLLEKSTAPEAQNLAADCTMSCDSACRLALFLNEQGMYPECKRILRALLEILPDSKIVEDCHQVARTAQKSRGNEKLTAQSLQGLLLSSEVFASRGLDHRAAINKAVFMAAFPTSKAAVNRMFKASNHRLPKKFSQIMNKKLWPTLSEPNLIQSAAAWEWLRHYMSNKLSQSGVKLKDWWQTSNIHILLLNQVVCFFTYSGRT